MSKARYAIAIVIAAIIFGAGVGFFVIGDSSGISYKLEMSAIFYGLGTLVANLIWFDGPVIAAAKLGIKFCGAIILWVISLFGSCLGWAILLLLSAFIATALAAIVTFTLAAILLLSAVMFPINLFRFGRDLY